MNHLWQSTLFAGVVWLLTLALKKNRARVRCWLWLAASIKFLIPLSVLIALGSHIEWRKAPEIKTSNIYVVMDEFSQPFTAPVFSEPLAAARNPLPAVLWGIWACGFIGISGSWWIRWRRILAAVRDGSPVQIEIPVRVMSSPSLLEPGIFGVFRPVLMLPEGIFDRLTPAQLEAVIEHELCHVRHRDNLIAAIHMFVETVFWFHPLVWWIGKRMVEERELACDEEVLNRGGDARVYAEAILSVCKLYVESPLECVAGVTGSDLKKRIEAIVSNHTALRLSYSKKGALATLGLAAVALPISVGMMSGLAQSAPTPKFEVASVRACQDSEPRGRKDGQNTSPGSVRLSCQTLHELVESAYIFYANGRRNPPRLHQEIEGGPSWINSDRFQINAKAESTQSQGMMRGPMMQALLESRFELKIHRETRQVPVYTLTVAKGGPKLRASKEGSCFAVDFEHPPSDTH